MELELISTTDKSLCAWIISYKFSTTQVKKKKILQTFLLIIITDNFLSQFKQNILELINFLLVITMAYVVENSYDDDNNIS